MLKATEFADFETAMSGVVEVGLSVAFRTVIFEQSRAVLFST
jgi:hypothetical protein